MDIPQQNFLKYYQIFLIQSITKSFKNRKNFHANFLTTGLLPENGIQNPPLSLETVLSRIRNSALLRITNIRSRNTQIVSRAQVDSTKAHNPKTIVPTTYSHCTGLRVSGSGDGYSVRRSRPCNHVGRSKVIHRFGLVLERTTALDHTSKIYI